MDNEKQSNHDELESMLYPTGVSSGVMKVDPDKCIRCGLCVQNCAFKCLGEGETPSDVPKMKGGEYICFSCYNCMVACPKDAISVVDTFRITGGFFDTGYPPHKPPSEPRDKDGNPAEWTEVEKTVMLRRSVRNFKKDPVPEPLIRRVLEAGRFGPSGGNTQPWKFTVVTDPEFIAQLEAACHQVFAGMYSLMLDEEKRKALVEKTQVGIFDPRVQNGVRLTANKKVLSYGNAPCAIFIGTCDRHTFPDLSAGIAAQNMNLVACSLGLGCFYSNFAAGGVNLIPELKSMLGFDSPWDIKTVLCLGYPAFKQEGIVPRFARPVKWFRPGTPPQDEA